MAFFRPSKKWLLRMLAVTLVFFIMLMGLNHFFTPLLNKYKPDLEKVTSQMLDRPVKIGHVYLSWYYYTPVIGLEQVALLDKKTQQPALKIEEIKITFKLLKSLLERRPIPDYLKVVGVNLRLTEATPGQIYVVGFGKFSLPGEGNSTPSPVEENKIADVIFSQPYLALENIKIDYQSLKKNNFQFTLNKVSLQNAGTSHDFKSSVTLHQKINTNLTLNVSWKGKTFDPAQVNSRFYLYLEGISLPQWLSNQTWHDLQVNQGLGSIKIWANWRNNQWHKIQTEFQFYEMEVTSLATKKTQIISRLNGKVEWKRDGKNQIISGDELLIDLPDHLWPTTNFSATLVPLKTGAAGLQLTSLRIKYLDLFETKSLVVDSGLLPSTLQKTLTDLAPSGEMYNLKMQLNDATHLDKNEYSAEFIDLSFSPWGKFPGLQHFDGSFHWSNKQGDIKIYTDNLAMDLPSIFANSLELDKVNADIELKKDDAGSYILNAKNISINSPSLQSNATINLILPPNASPVLDLLADFSINDTRYLSTYLPLNHFDVGLRHWLKNAFQGGKINEGHAIFKGNINDYPFYKKAGKFEISGVMHNMNLNYSPEWPAVNRIKGRLIFSGFSLLAEVSSADILQVPIQKIRIEIPYLGPQGPPILSLTGAISTDLNAASRFINQSPLNQTLGKGLANMKFSGPLDLNLKLTVPLKSLKTIKVVGDMDIKKGTLEYPTLKIAALNIQGPLHFTENGISANNLHAIFLTKPVVVTIQTDQAGTPSSIIKIKLMGQVAMSYLQKWLQLPIANYVQGQTNYTAELNLMADQNPAPNQIIIQSDLKGVVVNLPSIYGKKIDVPRNFNFILNFKQNKPLQFKSAYGNLFAAAMTLQGSKSGFEVTSGELSLGPQAVADWQTQPGLIVTGQLDTLNWDEWQKFFTNAGPNTSSTSAPKKTSSLKLRSVDIKANKLVALSQTLTQARVQLAQSSNAWLATIDSVQIAGKIQVPLNLTGPLEANFKYLYLVPSTTNNTQQTLAPQKLPTISFVGEDVRYGDMRLGKVNLELEHTATGVNIKQLRSTSKVVNVEATGNWQSLPKGEQTQLKGVLTTPNMSNFLNQWGIKSSNLIGSGGTVKFDLTWPSAPYAPAKETVAGNLGLKLTKGRIINLGNSTDAKMGLGRMINILSLQTIPHLLTFDFNSLFAQGYSFDAMSGDFTLQNGNVFAQKAHFDGSVARVEISGRLGLTAKDYDLILSLTPHVTGSLPMVAAIAINPIVGVAAWAVEKAAQSAVSKVTTYKFVVKGPWSNPTWQKQ